MKLTREQSTIYQAIKQYSPNSAMRYVQYISSSEYLKESQRVQSQDKKSLSDFSLKEKQRIIERIKLFNSTLPGNCAVCLDDISNISEFESDIFCCGKCRYIGKKLMKNGLWSSK